MLVSPAELLLACGFSMAPQHVAQVSLVFQHLASATPRHVPPVLLFFYCQVELKLVMMYVQHTSRKNEKKGREGREDARWEEGRGRKGRYASVFRSPTQVRYGSRPRTVTDHDSLWEEEDDEKPSE